MNYITITMKTRRILAKNIADYLNLNRLSVGDMSAKSGITRQYIYDILDAKTSASVDKIDLIADAMDITVSDLTKENLFKDFEVKIVKKKK